ncbi:MAG: ABC transporter ATP-binding protein [Dehalococcoidia bacterium]
MIRLEDLTVRLKQFALSEINMEVRKGEYFIILGPTGAGKTLLLETVAGLRRNDAGSIFINNIDVTRLEPERRKTGFVYQDYTLFPHLSVRDNIIFGLKCRRAHKSAINDKLAHLAELLNIGQLLERRPETLSGGEKQKVSLARALSTDPDVVLLDEPISALDPQQRESVQNDLKDISKKLNRTFIHVTHNFEEAVALGDRIAVLSEGRLLQTGSAEDIFRHPNSEFVARFAMTRNIFSGPVADDGCGGSVLIIDNNKLEVVTELRGRLHASIRPEDILISRDMLISSARNSIKGKITRIDDRGATLYVTVAAPMEFVCLVTRRSYEELKLAEGGEAYLTFKASAVHVF